jgi:hypothetical protein
LCCSFQPVLLPCDSMVWSKSLIGSPDNAQIQDAPLQLAFSRRSVVLVPFTARLTLGTEEGILLGMHTRGL